MDSLFSLTGHPQHCWVSLQGQPITWSTACEPQHLCESLSVILIKQDYVV